ncbi:MAG: HSP20 family protein [Candidatus Omnitrophota bacterium]|jgi:HSP20 family protein
MNLVPRKQTVSLWDPFNELERFQKEMSGLYDTRLSNWPKVTLGNGNHVLALAVDVADQKDRVVVKADIPGIDKKDLDINVTQDVLTIKGEKKEVKDTNEKGLVRSERYYGSFQRTIELPAEVDSSKVTASYKDGVLEIMLPKKEEAQAKQAKIEVK